MKEKFSMNKKITLLKIILLTMFTIPAQAWFWDSSLNDYKDEFREQVLEVNKQKEETKSKLKETKNLIFDFASLLQNSKKEDVNFKKLYNKWQDSESEIKDLEIKFKSLVESASIYFSQIKVKANDISDKNLKDSALKNIITNKNKYILQLKNTHKSLENLTISHRKLKDLITFLEISTSLQSLDKELKNRFSEIDTIVKDVMNDLDKLYKESQELLNE